MLVACCTEQNSQILNVTIVFTLLLFDHSSYIVWSCTQHLVISIRAMACMGRGFGTSHVLACSSAIGTEFIMAITVRQ